MKNKGLLFIPDISGFSRFISETEIEHSRLIIQELLEVLINANELGLEISEIEGDAILFYKFGDPPQLSELYRQVEKMFCAFHRNIIAYEHRRYCQCKACISAVDLTLKVITHYGEFTGYNVKNFSKLIGKDLIIAHQLLKNDIEHHEYWLITKNLLQGNNASDLAEWIEWNTSVKQTESGEVPFQYTHLSQLKNEISPEPFPQLEIAEKVKMLSVSREYETDIITLLHAAGDFNYRNRWQDGVRAVEEVDHFLPRIGMKCRFTTDNGHAIVYASSYYFQPDRVEFSETDETKKSALYFTLETTGIRRTKLTLDFYLKKDPVAQLMFKLIRKKRLENTFHKSMENLTGLVKEIVIPGITDVP